VFGEGDGFMGFRYLGSPNNLVGNVCHPDCWVCILWFKCSIIVCVLVFYPLVSVIGSMLVISWNRGL
jgi:hypothetical protein